MLVSERTAKTTEFPPELNDPEWLAARYGSLGDETIAAELSVSLKAVQRARQRLGIKPRKPARDKPPERASATSSAGRASVSDQELARRVKRVKTGLEVVAATLARLINDAEWVREQLETSDAPPPTSPAADVGKAKTSD
jgi:hypothetical protein